MKKHHHGAKAKTQATTALPGVVDLLVTGGEHPLPDEIGTPCRKISESIYQCLADSCCRYRFPYESIRLCSWPNASTPERTPHNLPCRTDNHKKEK